MFNWSKPHRKINVGDVMTSSAPMVPTIKIKREVTALTSHRGHPVSVILAVGDYVYEGFDSEGQYYRSPIPLQILYGKKQQNSPGGIFISNDSSVQAAAYWLWTLPAIDLEQQIFVAYLSDIPPHSITKDEKLMDTIGFVSTLTYGGVAGDQIKFIYREYNNNLARMAFTQEVTLDYKPDQLYAYKNLRFTVHYADSVVIEYTMLQPFSVGLEPK